MEPDPKRQKLGALDIGPKVNGNDAKADLLFDYLKRNPRPQNAQTIIDNTAKLLPKPFKKDEVLTLLGSDHLSCCIVESTAGGRPAFLYVGSADNAEDEMKDFITKYKDSPHNAGKQLDSTKPGLDTTNPLEGLPLENQFAAIAEHLLTKLKADVSQLTGDIKEIETTEKEVASFWKLLKQHKEISEEIAKATAKEKNLKKVSGRAENTAALQAKFQTWLAEWAMRKRKCQEIADQVLGEADVTRSDFFSHIGVSTDREELDADWDYFSKFTQDTTVGKIVKKTPIIPRD